MHHTMALHLALHQCYQEFAISYSGVCPININLHFFLDGCAFTFGGARGSAVGPASAHTGHMGYTWGTQCALILTISPSTGVWLITSGRSNDATPHLGDEIEISEEIGRDEQLLALSPEERVPTSAPPPPSKAQPLVAALDAAQAQAQPPRPGHLATIHSQKLKLDLSRESSLPPGRGGEPEHRTSLPRASRRTSLAEAWGLPDGGVDARAHRSSRAASVTTFLSVVGGGHSAAFLFDPTDKRDYAHELKAARSASIAHANRQYRHSLSISHSISHSVSGAVMGSALRPRGGPEADGHSVAVTFPGPTRASTQATPNEPAASTEERPSA